METVSHLWFFLAVLNNDNKHWQTNAGFVNIKKKH